LLNIFVIIYKIIVLLRTSFFNLGVYEERSCVNGILTIKYGVAPMFVVGRELYLLRIEVLHFVEVDDLRFTDYRKNCSLKIPVNQQPW
jgi:hypothetical protein